ncbi:hypothetical protein PTSG_05959 [Salpingoeca rosetta]|uniref:Uncharacterized protein n=1 Tax=Salpingoeca rosetta (strain ATCC 50818 / BSB-021) TaxID=946362 RepID=F2UD99_SALR5|nr:uncharacterized protein PTSG_05959 [Salpingoeca rosetta]EGD74594.1 hypothetical protein PTSG_05959 [Salpingoeca rosetta]|eukprot:XP_004992851.1 hypothetical protein PTSG_05959 [Salpingoeca rosetta]
MAALLDHDASRTLSGSVLPPRHHLPSFRAQATAAQQQPPRPKPQHQRRQQQHLQQPQQQFHYRHQHHQQQHQQQPMQANTNDNLTAVSSIQPAPQVLQRYQNLLTLLRLQQQLLHAPSHSQTTTTNAVTPQARAALLTAIMHGALQNPDDMHGLAWLMNSNTHDQMHAPLFQQPYQPPAHAFHTTHHQTHMSSSGPFSNNSLDDGAVANTLLHNLLGSQTAPDRDVAAATASSFVSPLFGNPETKAQQPSAMSFDGLLSVQQQLRQPKLRHQQQSSPSSPDDGLALGPQAQQQHHQHHQHQHQLQHQYQQPHQQLQQHNPFFPSELSNAQGNTVAPPQHTLPSTTPANDSSNLLLMGLTDLSSNSATNNAFDNEARAMAPPPAASVGAMAEDVRDPSYASSSVTGSSEMAEEDMFNLPDLGADDLLMEDNGVFDISILNQLEQPLDFSTLSRQLLEGSVLTGDADADTEPSMSSSPSSSSRKKKGRKDGQPKKRRRRRRLTETKKRQLRNEQLRRLNIRNAQLKLALKNLRKEVVQFEDQVYTVFSKFGRLPGQTPVPVAEA